MSKFKSLLTTGFLIGALAMLIGPSQALAKGGGKLVGTWRGAAVSGAFFALFVFNKDNTMTERCSVKTVSSGRGVWEKIDGNDTFAVTFELFEDSDSDGEFDTRLRIRSTIQVENDTFNGTATFDEFTRHHAGGWPVLRDHLRGHPHDGDT